MATPVNKIIQSLESLLEQCEDKQYLAIHNKIKDSSIYYEGMVDVLRYAVDSFNNFSIKDEEECLYSEYESGFTDAKEGRGMKILKK